MSLPRMTSGGPVILRKPKDGVTSVSVSWGLSVCFRAGAAEKLGDPPVPFFLFADEMQAFGQP